MGVTDYRCNKDEIATISLIAHEIIVAKHKRREFALSVALALSVIIGIISFVL
jgi:uncharacterized membrane protein (DUF373 family)